MLGAAALSPCPPNTSKPPLNWGRCGHTARKRSAAGKPHEMQVARAVALTKSGVKIDVVAVGVAHGRDPMSPWRVERLMGAA
jgi:hypothetical protein